MKIKLVGAQEQWAAVVPLKSFIELFIVVLGGETASGHGNRRQELSGKSSGDRGSPKKFLTSWEVRGD